MSVLIIIIVVVILIFLFLVQRYHSTKLKDVVNEKYSNNDLNLPDIILQYNNGIENIQNHIEEQNNSINSIKVSTYDKKTVDSMIGNIQSDLNNSKEILHDDILKLEKEVKVKTPYDYVNNNFYNKNEISKTLASYATQKNVDLQMSEINKKAEDSYITKSAAYSTFVDKGKVVNLENNVNELKTKTNTIENQQNTFFNTLPTYVTKSDLTAYARYTDFADLNKRFSENVKDMSKNYETVNSFIGIQSDINKTFHDKDELLQNDVLKMQSNHEDLVNKLGNYLNAEQVYALLQESYAPLPQFNILSDEVDDLYSNLNNLDIRTRNVENNLKMKDTQLCLSDPISKKNVCMMGTEFSLLKDIMNQYYSDQAEDSKRLQELEAANNANLDNIRRLKKELEDTEVRRIIEEEEAKKARDLIKQEAIQSDIEMQKVISNAIYEVKVQTQNESENIRQLLVTEEQKSNEQRNKILALNSQLQNVRGKLNQVELVDAEQNDTINELKTIIEDFEEQKKKFKETIIEKDDTITLLEKERLRQNLVIQEQDETIKMKEEDLNVCNSLRSECVDINLPNCRNENIEKQQTIINNEKTISDLELELSEWKDKYELTESLYNALQEDCRPKITQEQCDDQDRVAYQKTLFKNDAKLFDANVIIRNTLDPVLREEMMTKKKNQIVDNFKTESERKNRSLFNMLNDYNDSNQNYQWADFKPECPNYDDEINMLRTQVRNFKSQYDKCILDKDKVIEEETRYRYMYDECIRNKKQCETNYDILNNEYDEASRNRCNGCDYYSILKGQIVNNKIDDSTIKGFCVKDVNDTAEITRKQQQISRGPWGSIDVMHRPNCEDQLNALRVEIENLKNQKHWIKFHGNPTGTRDLAPATQVNSIDACKQKCENTPSCSLYVYNTQSRNCTLKTDIPVFETFENAKKKPSQVENFVSMIEDQSAVLTKSTDNKSFNNINPDKGEFKFSDAYNYLLKSILPAQDCEYTWLPAECNKDTGLMVSRLQITKQPRRGGAACPSSQEKVTTCPVNCELSDEVEWGSNCEGKCGPGHMNTGIKKIKYSEKNGGNPCPSREVTQPCPFKQCIQNCEMSEWSLWTPCDCANTGTQTRTRKMIKAPTGGGAACPNSTESRDCRSECQYPCELSSDITWETTCKCDGTTTSKTGRKTIIKGATNGGPCNPVVNESCPVCRDCIPEFEYNSCTAVCDLSKTYDIETPINGTQTCKGFKEKITPLGNGKKCDMTGCTSKECQVKCKTEKYVKINDKGVEYVDKTTFQYVDNTDLENKKREFQSNNSSTFVRWGDTIDCAYKNNINDNVDYYQAPSGGGSSCPPKSCTLKLYNDFDFRELSYEQPLEFKPVQGQTYTEHRINDFENVSGKRVDDQVSSFQLISNNGANCNLKLYKDPVDRSQPDREFSSSQNVKYVSISDLRSIGLENNISGYVLTTS
jgi:hypothetical protein